MSVGSRGKFLEEAQWENLKRIGNGTTLYVGARDVRPKTTFKRQCITKAIKVVLECSFFFRSLWPFNSP